MPSVSFSDSQFHSHFFLQQLWSDSSESLSELTQQNVQRTTVKTDATHRLIIAAEGLNLAKVYQVQHALNDGLSFVSFTDSAYSPHCQTQAIVAQVNVQNEQVNELLEQVSGQTRTELFLLPVCPSLNAPGLLVMDMDSTMIGCECIDEIAYLAGVGEQVSEVTELAMQGKLDFAQSLHQRVACLEGVPLPLLQGLLDKLPIMSGLSVLINELKKNGWKVVVASGGFTYFANHLRDRFELDAAVSNVLETADNKLTGKVVGQVVDASVKAATVKELADKWNIDAAQTIAMGDGANDLLMMKEAAYGVAYHAKPVVRQQAKLAIRHSGLDTLLHIFG
ncbi:phosphoserine phosphatase SerB [Neptunicella sp. SCSIO 80796]|uniref:phosphoserine phosphatase SerB n=1 Tax=Neptunicella plasticusilytica TaxID=3117012 RepID=UPI003A4E473B